MKADYYRYDAEFQTDETRDESLHNATLVYEAGLQAADELDFVDGAKLSLILNYAVFIVDRKGEKEKGREIAKAAIENAEKLIAAGAEKHPSTDVCLALLRDDLVLWAEDGEIGSLFLNCNAIST
jgi:14-3-3 protein epsilon